jgi:hypothetical protein
MAALLLKTQEVPASTKGEGRVTALHVRTEHVGFRTVRSVCCLDACSQFVTPTDCTLIFTCILNVTRGSFKCDTCEY